MLEKIPDKNGYVKDRIDFLERLHSEGSISDHEVNIGLKLVHEVVKLRHRKILDN